MASFLSGWPLNKKYKNNQVYIKLKGLSPLHPLIDVDAY